MTIKEIDARIKAAEDRRHELEANCRRLEAEHKDAAAAAQAAAEAGDLDEYITRSEIAKRAEAAAYVAKQQLAKASDAGITGADIRDAWDTYARQHEAAQRKRIAAYDKLRKDLFKIYSEMISEQNEAYRVRESCAARLGRPVDALADGNTCGLALAGLPESPTSNGLSFRGINWTSPEMVYFAISGDAPQNWPDLLFNVVHRHRHSENTAN